MIAAVLALETFGDRLVGSDVLLFIDSEAVEAALVKGYSSKEDLCRIISVFPELALGLRVRIFIDRVSTDANPADWPTQLWELTGELLGAKAEPETARPMAADPKPKSSGSCVRLQDLAQDRSRRFAEELEFVQCLANPSYVQWLATQGFFREPGFQRFLEYLTYWRRPQYVRYIVYPQCLAVLDLLLRPAVRLRLHRADVISILADQLQHAWGQQDEVPLRNSHGEEVQEGEAEQMLLSAEGWGPPVVALRGLGQVALGIPIDDWLLKHATPNNTLILERF
eukprot:s2572_g1.t1